MALEEGKESKSSHILTLRRIIWGIVALGWFLWIGYEDRSLTPVLALSALISFAIGLEIRFRQRLKQDRSERHESTRSIAVGIFAGAIVGLISVLLALVKTSLHQHVVTDFSSDDLILLLKRIPVWALTGTLFGAAASLMGRAKDYNK